MNLLQTIKKKVTSLLLLLIAGNCVSAQVKSYQKTGYGVSFNLNEGKMNIYLIKNDLVEVKYTSLKEMADKKSLVVETTPTYLKTFAVTENNADIFIETSKLKISVNRKTQAIIYADLSGNIILAEADNNKTMSDTTVADIKTHKCSTSFKSPQNEGLFGLGCHPLDTLSINYKGRNQDMAIKYLTGAIPVLLSTNGYGLLFDNYAASKFYGAELNNSQFTYASESGKMVDYYFFYGPSFDHIIDSYRALTGKAPMYAKWVFGLFQSQDRYKKQEEVLEAADGYRKNHIPVDAIVQDWYYWEPLPIGSHILNPDRYPNPKAMVDKLHEENMHAMISIWPVFGSGTANFDALKKMGGLTSITWDNFVTKTFDTYYDAHNPAARDLYWKQAKDSLVKRYGWDGWWVDQCEPDNGELLDERKKADFSVGKGIDYFNTFSLMHSEGLYKNWRKDIPNKRAYFLIRQSFAGEQRNAATLWSSDITTTFDAFRSQVPQAINACVSGIPYWTSDIGGYLSHTSKDGIPDWSQPSYRELFTRWFQFGAFSPIFRIHGKGERALFSKNWDDSTRNILLKYDNLRYRLLPYIYSLSSKVTTENYTIMRSLAFDFRADEKVYNIPDQYMFGPAFLVNPVTAQLYSTANANQLEKTRTVYLPKGVDWYDFWTGKKLAGGQTINATATIGTMPLYVKAGSIIPMGETMEYATQKLADNIEIRIYPGADGQFTLYEDANDTYNYEKGEFANITFNWNDKIKQLNISARKGTFPGMLKTRTFKIILVKENKAIGVAETVQVDKKILYNGTPVNAKL